MKARQSTADQDVMNETVSDNSILFKATTV